ILPTKHAHKPGDDQPPITDHRSPITDYCDYRSPDHRLLATDGHKSPANSANTIRFSFFHFGNSSPPPPSRYFEHTD
ncbi:MAG: hypothetical protein ABIR06_06030, partial [Cyclobacteriaceae bacterium]